MKCSIREYQPSDQDAVRKLYLEQSQRTERQRVVSSVIRHSTARRSWQAGIVGILSLQLTPMLTHRAAVIAMALWSAGIGLTWFFWIREQDRRRAFEDSQRIANHLATLHEQQQEGYNRVWVMMQDNTQGLVGAVGLEYVYEEGEGRIWNLTGVESRIQLALVQKVIQFARQSDISVLVEMKQSIPETVSS
ncbi:hypothetical protein O0I10_012335 [Lichtheimia ornata]|uniref:Uncharacterized protein n=1 Tax=Lichtheimia ornata TaxID=688661 RepID=A0AAD7UTL3_9FUNG|nr:uncharacterized protein O0I10_012335 [Lichtheimia ornata]KAJ8652061.1 hypothetical protein O0I10_012335 [Lichtheimia ornata]